MAADAALSMCVPRALTYRLEVLEAHEGGVSHRKLSVTHQVGSATVERRYQSFVKQKLYLTRNLGKSPSLGVEV